MVDGTLYTARTRKPTSDPAGPILHAITLRAKRRGRTCRRAVCGAGVQPEWRGTWNPTHPRACPACGRTIRRGEA